MSHIVTIATRIKDLAALAEACRLLGLTKPLHGTTNLFSGEATGHLVQLPGWRYPLVVDLVSGALHYDNYQGAWGEQRQLERLLQQYAVEKTRLEARRAGHDLTEQRLPDGSVRRTITTSSAGGAA
jgi:hypothetical protein